MFYSEVSNLREMFTANAYPVKFIDNVINVFYRKSEAPNASDPSESCEDQSPYILLRVPYFGKCYVKFAHNLTKIICNNNFNVDVTVVYI